MPHVFIRSDGIAAEFEYGRRRLPMCSKSIEPNRPQFGIFSRRHQVLAAMAPPLQALINEFQYVPFDNETTFDSLLIVDESVASGLTIAASLDHLRRHSLKRSCRITVAAHAWLV
jgi:hypothetical protein